MARGDPFPVYQGPTDGKLANRGCGSNNEA
jgi:hypothetical protein